MLLLAWKSGLRFWIRVLEVPFLGIRKWAFSLKVLHNMSRKDLLMEYICYPQAMSHFLCTIYQILDSHIPQTLKLKKWVKDTPVWFFVHIKCLPKLCFSCQTSNSDLIWLSCQYHVLTCTIKSKDLIHSGVGLDQSGRRCANI